MYLQYFPTPSFYFKYQLNLLPAMIKTPRDSPITEQMVYQAFDKEGYPKNSMITKDALFQLLSKLYRSNTGETVSPALLEEFWDESQTTSKGEVSISVLARIVVNAQVILNERIDKLEDKNGVSFMQKEVERLAFEVTEAEEYYKDDKKRILEAKLNHQQMLQKYQTQQNDLNSFRADLKAIENIFKTEFKKFSLNDYAPVQSIIQELTKPQLSPKLLQYCQLTLLCLLLEMLVMSGLRLSFLTVLAYLHGLYIIVVGMYDLNAVLFLIVHTTVSVVADLIFFGMKVASKQELLPIAASGRQVYVFCLVIFLIVTLVLRLLALFILWGFRTAYTDTTLHYCNFFGQQLMLAPASADKWKLQRIINRAIEHLATSPAALIQPQTPELQPAGQQSSPNDGIMHSVLIARAPDLNQMGQPFVDDRQLRDYAGGYHIRENPPAGQQQGIL